MLIPAVAVLAGPLRILELGEDTAAGLGVRVGAARLGIVVAAGFVWHQYGLIRARDRQRCEKVFAAIAKAQ